MRKLFTCLYGSNLYGTATPVSDRDVKHIVLPPIEDLLMGKTVKNYVHKTNKDRNVKNGADDVDEEFIPIQVFAKDFLEGQTYALELAFAVDGDKAEQTFYDYRDTNRFKQFCVELRYKFLTSTMKGMMGYAVNQAELYSNKGERLNAAKELNHLFSLYMHYPDMKLSDAPPQFHLYVEALAAKFPNCAQITTYDQDGKGNIQPCIKFLGRIIPFSSSVHNAVITTQKIIDRYGARANAASETNVDWKATMHAYRVILEGIHLLRDRTLTFPFPTGLVYNLLAIKRGEVPYEEVRMQLEENMALLTKLEAESDLPKLTYELHKEFEEWLVDWLKEFYL